MEWVVGIYLFIGVAKTIGKLTDPNPAAKPVWMSTETDSFKYALMLTFYTVFWPLAK